MHKFKSWSRWKKGLFFLTVFIILFVELFPIFMVVTTSFKPKLQIWTSKSPFELFRPTFKNYLQVFKDRNFAKYIKNSLIIASITTFIALFLGSLAAYGFARFKFRGNFLLSMGVLASRMIPPITLSVPIFILISEWKLLDTYFSMILAHISFSLPYVIWLLLPFFKGIPASYEEAAMLDGCSRQRVFFSIFLPLVAPGLVVAAIFTFMLSWNDFLYALVLTSSRAKTAPLAVSEFIGQFAPEWGMMTAAGTVFLIPVFIFALGLQKYIIHGLAFGGDK